MKSKTTSLTRREAISSLAVGLGGVSALASLPGWLSGCAGGLGATTGDGGSISNGSSSSGSVTSDSGIPGSATAWAGGGTVAMTGAASYPNPFTTPTAACTLVASATEGPCTEAADRLRRDISEGLTGLPMRLALRVVDSACNPIAGAKVKIWHTHIAGSYSGDTPNNGLCLKQAADSSKHYFRGVQTTNTDGRVDFDSCFPGWYPGRTIHIHFTVSAGGRSFTSQLVFDQALVSEIFSTHIEYRGYGQPDTTNTSDNVVGRANLASYMLATARMPDGVMLASKELVVSLS